MIVAELILLVPCAASRTVYKKTYALKQREKTCIRSSAQTATGV